MTKQPTTSLSKEKSAGDINVASKTKVGLPVITYPNGNKLTVFGLISLSPKEGK